VPAKPKIKAKTNARRNADFISISPISEQRIDNAERFITNRK